MSAQQKSKKGTPAKKNRQEVAEEPKKMEEEPKVTVSNANPQQTETPKKTKKSTTKKNQASSDSFGTTTEEQKKEEEQDFQETGTGSSHVKQEESKGQKKTKKQKDVERSDNVQATEDKDTNTESQTTQKKPKKTVSKKQVSQFRGGELTFEKLSIKDDADSATSGKSRHINGYQKFQSVQSKSNPNFGDRAKEWGKLSKEQKGFYNDTPLEILVSKIQEK